MIKIIYFHLIPQFIFLLFLSSLNGALFSNLIKQTTKTTTGGHVVKPSFKYPFIVSLQYKNKHSCGGTLIKANKVITAAHCNLDSVVYYKALWHRHDLKLDNEAESGKTFEVIRIVDHPNFESEERGFDVSIWTLNVPAVFQEYYRQRIEPKLYLDNIEPPISLQTNQFLFAAGWGRISQEGATSSQLLEIELPISNQARCFENYKNSIDLQLDSRTQFCAGYFEAKNSDTCQGDSGGPLFAKKDDNFVLVGVISYGVGCALPELPGVYTRLSGLIDFIQANL